MFNAEDSSEKITLSITGSIDRLRNEIGMGAVRDAVQAHVPHGPILCAELATDVLIPAGVSNWGAYAVVAGLAIHHARAEIAHSPAQERALVEACPALGLVDGTTGRLEATVDGMDLHVHTSIVQLLGEVVRRDLVAGNPLMDGRRRDCS